MSHVSDRESGLVSSHISGVERAMKERNTFLFLRPTEYDSTMLIEEGYATKSMDIHDKSSDWGPMAGFVPCDPAFSKVGDKAPNPDLHPHPHGDAQPIQLFLTDSLVGKLERAGKMVRSIDTRLRLLQDENVELDDQNTLSAAAPAPDAPRFYRLPQPPMSSPKDTYFCLIKQAGRWQVYWVHWSSTQRPGPKSGKLHQLQVWAYVTGGALKPVTGDYDMWMVAPHMSHLKSYPSLAAVDKVIDSHGSSAASKYTTDLIKLMNAACGRTDNTVFNHGAEAQNYGFAQKLDARIVMFTPAGTSRMVWIHDMPKVLVDVQNAGYLVLANKRYGELDPRLMGKVHPRLVDPDSEGREKKGASLWRSNVQMVNTRDRFRAAMRALQEIRHSPAVDRKPLAPSLWGLLSTAVKHGYEQSRIDRFYMTLTTLLSQFSSEPGFLSLDDFPEKYQRMTRRTHDLQLALQSAHVRASTGGGESDRATTDIWAIQHASELKELMDFWDA